MIAAATAVAKLGAFVVEHTPNLYTLGKAIDWVTGKTEDNTFATVTGESSTTAAVKKGTRDRRQLTEAELAEQERRRKELAAELERIDTAIAVRRLQIEQHLTEELAKEQVRRRSCWPGSPSGRPAPRSGGPRPGRARRLNLKVLPASTRTSRQRSAGRSSVQAWQRTLEKFPAPRNPRNSLPRPG